MIIQCDQCKTRFKLADDKISSKGVRVRCTKCQHTFVVRQSMEAAVAAVKAANEEAASPSRPAANPSPSPDLASGDPAQAPVSGGGPSLDDMFGTPAAPSPAADPAKSDAGPGLFGGPAFIGAEPGADPSRTQALFGDLDLGLGDAPASSADASIGSSPEQALESGLSGLDFGAAGYDPPLPVGPDNGPAAAASDAAAAVDLDAEPSPPASSSPALADGFDLDGGLDGSSPGADPSPGTSGVASDAEARAAIDAAAELDLDAAFGVAAASTGDPTALTTGAADASSIPDPPETADADGSAWTFDFDGADAPAPAAASAEAASIAVAAPGETASSGFEDWEIDDSGDGVPGFAPGGDALAETAAAGGSASEVPGGLDLGGTPTSAFFEAPESGGDDPFASLEFGEPSADLGADLGDPSSLEGGDDPGHFGGSDLSGHESSPASATADPVRPGGASFSQVAAAPAPVRAAPTPIPQPPSRRGLGPLLMNGLFVASLLAAGLGAFVATQTEGGLDTSLFSPARIARALGGGVQGLEVLSTVPGLYPRPGHSAVVYVRGTVRNGSSQTLEQPGVVASLVTAGGDVLGTVQAVVGGEPDAADLARLLTRADLASLEARLTGASISEIAPGATVPYFAIFLSAPDDPRAGLRFEVRPARTP